MNIIRYYNQNKKSLWIIATIIIVIIVVIQLANFAVKMRLQSEKEILEKQKVAVNEKDYKENPNINVEVTDDEVKEDNTLIVDQFYRYCNAGKAQQAYNLLSTSCKNNIYPSLEIFIKNYYNSIFTNTKLYSKEFYAGNTYKVKLYDDALSTGKVSGSQLEDFITIVKENNEPRLNISRFIKEEELNITGENEYIQVQVQKKIVYKECIEYILNVKNLTNKDIMLDSQREPKSAYLKSGTVNYYSALSENPSNDLVIYANLSNKIRIKYNLEYNKTTIPEKMVFTDIILDKKLYDSTEKKSEFKNVGKIEISLK